MYVFVFIKSSKKTLNTNQIQHTYIGNIVVMICPKHEMLKSQNGYKNWSLNTLKLNNHRSASSSSPTCVLLITTTKKRTFANLVDVVTFFWWVAHLVVVPNRLPLIFFGRWAGPLWLQHIVCSEKLWRSDLPFYFYKDRWFVWSGISVSIEAAKASCTHQRLDILFSSDFVQLCIY